MDEGSRHQPDNRTLSEQPLDSRRSTYHTAHFFQSQARGVRHATVSSHSRIKGPRPLINHRQRFLVHFSSVLPPHIAAVHTIPADDLLHCSGRVTVRNGNIKVIVGSYLDKIRNAADLFHG